MRAVLEEEILRYYRRAVGDKRGHNMALVEAMLARASGRKLTDEQLAEAWGTPVCDFNAKADEILGIDSSPREAWEAWWQFTGKRSKLVASSGNGRKLLLLERKHGLPALRQVLAWLKDSNHQRARFVRENGHATPDTIGRHFEDYLAFSEGHEVKPTRARGAQDILRSMRGGA